MSYSLMDAFTPVNCRSTVMLLLRTVAAFPRRRAGGRGQPTTRTSSCATRRYAWTTGSSGDMRRPGMTSRAPGLLGEVLPDHQRVRRPQEGQERHRPRQPLPRPSPGRGRRRRRQDQLLPRRAVPTHRPATRQEEGHRRRRPLHPDHRLAPAVRPYGRLCRPRPGPLRHPRRHPTRHPRPRPPPRRPRATRSPSKSSDPPRQPPTPSRLRCAPPGGRAVGGRRRPARPRTAGPGT
jgi:hypothetical protein